MSHFATGTVLRLVRANSGQVVAFGIRSGVCTVPTPRADAAFGKISQDTCGGSPLGIRAGGLARRTVVPLKQNRVDGRQTSIRSWVRGLLGHRRGVIVASVLLLASGGGAIGVAATSQTHAPIPTAAAAGSIGPLGADTSGRVPGRTITADRPKSSGPAGPTVEGPVLPASIPVAITIPAIGVHSVLRPLGLNPDGTLQVPQPGPFYNQAAWYKGSPTPGEPGPSIIEGHIDSAAEGPSVFFRLGALKPGDQVEVTLADQTVAVFTVTGIRQYPKNAFPTATVYGNTNFAALRLLTCGGTFNPATHSYEANTVVYAALTASHPTS